MLKNNSLLVIPIAFFISSIIEGDGTAISSFSDRMKPVYFIDSVEIGNNDSLKIEDEMTKGKVLYKKKCQKCHSLYDPGDFKLKVWKDNLKEMRRKAELSREEYNLILGYLSKNCKK